MYKCIYCLENKTEDFFRSAEHVIPQQLGLFDTETLTLINIVCDDCNKYFADNLELPFGRDTTFGIMFRSITGLLNKKSFKKSIRHNRTRFDVTTYDEMFGELLVDLEINENRNFIAKIASQMIFMNSTKGIKRSFRIKQLPHRNILQSMGFKLSNDHIYILSQPGVDSLKDINQLLKTNQINLSVTESISFTPLTLKKNDKLYFRSMIDGEIQRAIAKIVFNYFTTQYGSSVAMSEHFHDIRHFIRYGLKAEKYLLDMDHQGINEDLRHLDYMKYGRHILTIKQDLHSKIIIGELILFNHVKCKVILSRTYPILGLPFQSHTFDFINKMVINNVPQFRSA